MTVKELIEGLKKLPDETSIFFAECRHHELSITKIEVKNSEAILISSEWTNDCSCHEEP